MIWLVIASGGILLMVAMLATAYFFGLKMFGIPHIPAKLLVETMIKPEQEPDGFIKPLALRREMIKESKEPDGHER